MGSLWCDDRCDDYTVTIFFVWRLWYGLCMNLEYLGAEFNLTVLAGAAGEYELEFVRGEGVVLDVSGVTFGGVVVDAHGVERAIRLEHSERAVNVLHVVFPVLEEVGVCRYELFYASDDGERYRLAFGRVGVLSTRLVLERFGALEQAGRRLRVSVPGVAGGHLELEWLASTAAIAAAQQAVAVLERLQGVADDAVKRAEDAAGRAEDAADRVEDAEENVLGKLGAAQAFMESFNKALFEAIRVVDNYLWVGGVNTGYYLRGQDGITPHIGTDGYWYVGTQRLGDRPAFGKDGITPHITEDGFWAFGETKTTVRAEGRDGLDGTAVRRILVGSYEEIPQSGETCNGGFLYYVPAGVERAQRQVASLPTDAVVSNYNLTGPLVFSESRTWTRRGGRLMRFGLMAGSNTQGGEPSEELLYVHLYYELAGVWYYAGRSVEAVAQAVNAVSWWDFEELEVVPRGCRVKVVLSQVEAEPTEEQMEAVRIQVAAVATTEGSKVGEANFCAWAYWGFETEELTAYDVYAWCESDGAGSWVRVDLNYDIATSEVYGVNKLGTDQVVRDGAPVGVNAAGQMAVPLADPALPGTVMPATATADAEGGQTFVRDGRMWVRMANLNLPGVGKTSYTRVVPENTNSIGLTKDGKFAVPRAEAFQWGVSKVGSSVPQSNGMPWIIPVAMAETGVLNEFDQDITGQLMNNVLVGGALRTGTKKMWKSWAPNGINVNLLPDGNVNLMPEGSNAVGLMTSRSFSQNAAEGLVLEAATESLLGGVRVCHTIGSGAPGNVPTVNAVAIWCQENFYKKEVTFTRDEVIDRVAADIAAALVGFEKAETIKRWVQEVALAGYERSADLVERGYITMAQAAERFMRRSDNVVTVKVVRPEDLPAAAAQEKGVLYVTASNA